MRLVPVAAAVVNQTPLDWDGNLRNILSCLDAARQQQISVVCLPELCIPGYGCEDAFQSPAVWRMSIDVLREILPHTSGMIVSLGLPLSYGGALFNTACLVVDGRIIGFTAKRFLAGDGIHYEPRWFKAWPVGQRVNVALNGEEYPLGDLHYDCGGVQIGFEICEDAWVANRPGAELSRRGVDIILNPSASHFAFGKLDVRRRFVLEGSRAFGCSYVYANLLGNESGRAIYDGGGLVASGGKLVAGGPRFSFADWGLTTAVIDIDQTRMIRARTASHQPRIAAEAPLCVVAPFTFPAAVPRESAVAADDWERSAQCKEEEFTRAVGLALFDYLRKSGLHGFVVSLSGGADSTAVALLVALSVRLGVSELGLEGFCAKLPRVTALAGATDERELVRRLLACVYQSTRNSGEVTRNAAQTVAESLGATYYEFDVDTVMQQYVDIVAEAIGRPLAWSSDDIALQNIQARARAPGIWLLANLRQSLLLATSNRSEAAVGYCTMDGDTCGSISPIAGIDKHFLRQWLRWMQQQGPHGLTAVTALEVVTRQVPTAELRPPDAEQTDEGDLMPYDLLDAIERAAIRDKRSPVEVFQLMRVQFTQYSTSRLGVWVARFFRLWCRNQWKRERYAPSFHLDDENLDPKTWCRFPILSGGFERELAELRDLLDAETVDD
jgi:NAD+ synthase (glutamine-hydrolysing)